MSIRIGDKVRVSSSPRMSDTTPSRPAIVKDLKWNLVQVRFEDGEHEYDWIDCRLIKQENKTAP